MLMSHDLADLADSRPCNTKMMGAARLVLLLMLIIVAYAFYQAR
jgi:hypothetical protein